MEVEVTFYGSLRALAGGRTRRIRVDGDRPTVADLRAALARAIPEVAPHLPVTAVGLDARLATDDHPLGGAEEIALLPPASGG